MQKKRTNQKETDLETDIQKLKKSQKKSQEDCMITNGKKAELKALWEKELKVYYYVLNLDGLSMFRMQHI